MFKDLIRYVNQRFDLIQNRMNKIIEEGRIETDDYAALIARQGELILLRNMIENLVEEIDTNSLAILDNQKTLQNHD